MKLSERKHLLCVLAAAITYGTEMRTVKQHSYCNLIT